MDGLATSPIIRHFSVLVDHRIYRHKSHRFEEFAKNHSSSNWIILQKFDAEYGSLNDSDSHRIPSGFQAHGCPNDCCHPHKKKIPSSHWNLDLRKTKKLIPAARRYDHQGP